MKKTGTGIAHAAFLADQAKVAGSREIAEKAQARVERLCLCSGGVDLVLRAAKVEEGLRPVPAIRLGAGALEVLSRPLAAAVPEDPEKLFVRRGILQVSGGSRKLGAARTRPEPQPVEAFDPSEEDRQKSIDMPVVEEWFHGAAPMWIAVLTAAAGILAGLSSVWLSG